MFTLRGRDLIYGTASTRLGWHAPRVLAHLAVHPDASLLDLARAIRPQVRTVTPEAVRTQVCRLRAAARQLGAPLDIRPTYYKGYRLHTPVTVVSGND